MRHVAPLRERGSKQATPTIWIDPRASLPCGSVDRNLLQQSASLLPIVAPLRERGSKPLHLCAERSRCVVAPFAGAWIETARSRLILHWPTTVAPLAGAWIETISSETSRLSFDLSLPLRERGSKPVPWIDEAIGRASLPLRERGSKLHLRARSSARVLVAPFAGAWIETFGSPDPDCGAAGRSLRGSVDRNFFKRGELLLCRVAPLAGAWIETSWRTWCQNPTQVAPFAGAWIETSDSLPYMVERSSRSLRGSVDRNRSSGLRTLRNA